MQPPYHHDQVQFSCCVVSLCMDGCVRHQALIQSITMFQQGLAELILQHGGTLPASIPILANSDADPCTPTPAPATATASSESSLAASSSATTAATSKKGLSYADAGVSIDEGNRLVDTIKPAAASTMRPGADTGLGGFGGLFDLRAAGYTDPLLVSGTDGVGTKLELAHHAGKHDTIGIDLVAMCANDIIVQGAEPLFFLDYLATGKLDVAQMADVVRGVAAGCKEVGAALIGGETAEMPGMYSGKQYDVAGFCVGAVNRHMLLPQVPSIRAGDVLIGLPSSGIHSNGFSLVRRIIAAAGVAWDSPTPYSPTCNPESRTICEDLLTPTRLYVKPLLAVFRAMNTAKAEAGEAVPVRAAAHITGGGLLENIPRVLPRGLCAQIDCASWRVPAVFRWLQAAGGVDPLEMCRTFNVGIGMVLVVDATAVEGVLGVLTGEGGVRLGELRAVDASGKQVDMVGVERLFV